MATATTSVHTDWRQEWFDIEDATFLNAAGNAPMPKVALRATQSALDWKKFPHRIPDSAYFETPARIRESIAQLIGAKTEEIALTTGASAGTALVAYNLDWKTGDEVLTGKGEFPLQFTTWKPMEEREGVKLTVVSPQNRFITADDFIAALSPRTRLVSASLVRFDDGVLLDAAKLAAACRAQGTFLLLDASQCCGAIPMDVATLGADFVVCAGYKWLLSPYGTGFLWAKNERVAKMRPGPFYWMALDGADRFASLVFTDPKPAAGARRWDSAETASYFNLAGMDASLQFVLNLGPQTVSAHNRKLIDLLYERLPKDRCIPSSPLDATQRGPYGCFAARTPEKTAALFENLQKENVIISLREGNIRVSPHLYNTERDIDRLIEVITA
ncbi:MAG TPA: aminotransferase class V-fold PLP-dependent enzyme [Candidatus Saccharimonadales bacterium]|jgi:cysteine desulfurase/selenocysteine lyase|nr:aminotransferase class V-fold PLP-dependent enzyme [Candidatus Saccharimonadales bacterium]